MSKQGGRNNKQQTTNKQQKQTNKQTNNNKPIESAHSVDEVPAGCDLSKEETPIEIIKYRVHQVEDSLMLDEFCMTMPW
jgi:hypothetical protein